MSAKDFAVTLYFLQPEAASVLWRQW